MFMGKPDSTMFEPTFDNIHEKVSGFVDSRGSEASSRLEKLTAKLRAHLGRPRRTLEVEQITGTVVYSTLTKAMVLEALDFREFVVIEVYSQLEFYIRRDYSTGVIRTLVEAGRTANASHGDSRVPADRVERASLAYLAEDLARIGIWSPRLVEIAETLNRYRDGIVHKNWARICGDKTLHSLDQDEFAAKGIDAPGFIVFAAEALVRLFAARTVTPALVEPLMAGDVGVTDLARDIAGSLDAGSAPD
jgi:hypothetical protein